MNQPERLPVGGSGLRVPDWTGWPPMGRLKRQDGCGDQCQAAYPMDSESDALR